MELPVQVLCVGHTLFPNYLPPTSHTHFFVGSQAFSSLTILPEGREHRDLELDTSCLLLSLPLTSPHFLQMSLYPNSDLFSQGWKGGNGDTPCRPWHVLLGTTDLIWSHPNSDIDPKKY